MEKIFANVCKNFETELVEFDGENDHVHLLVNYPQNLPGYSKANFTNQPIAPNEGRSEISNTKSKDERNREKHQMQ